MWNDLMKVLDLDICTPHLVYSEADIEQNITLLKSGLARKNNQRVSIYYAVKSCYSKGLLKKISSMGVGAEIMSELEYNLCINSGFNPHNIIVNGLSRTKMFLQKAVDYGSLIIIDTDGDLAKLKQIYAANSTSIRLGIRIKIPIELLSGVNTPYKRQSHKLGIAPDSPLFSEILSFISQHDEIKLEMIHAHTTINDVNPDIYKICIKYMSEVVNHKIHAKYGLKVEAINLGGGFATFSRDQTEQRLSLFTTIKDAFDDAFPEYDLIVEPGRYISNSPGYVVTTVTDIKEVDDKYFLFVDANMNVLIPIPDSRYRLISPTQAYGEGIRVSICDSITNPSHVIIEDCLLKELD